MKKPTTPDEYISGFPVQIRKKLEQVRATVHKAVPQAEEIISYSMPAYKLNGILVWFAGHSKHIGFYPKASGIEKFKKELANYKSSKGSVRFPIDKPLPLRLISKIARYRAAENLRKFKAKK